MRSPDIRLSTRTVRTIGSSADVSSSKHLKRSYFCLGAQTILLEDKCLLCRLACSFPTLTTFRAPEILGTQLTSHHLHYAYIHRTHRFHIYWTSVLSCPLSTQWVIVAQSPPVLKHYYVLHIVTSCSYQAEFAPVITS